MKAESKMEKVFSSGFRKKIRLSQILMKNPLSLISALLIFGLAAIFAQPAIKTSAQTIPFRVGEKLTYHVSFGKITDAAYGEIFVSSRGKIKDKEAVELQAKFKTTNLVSAFYLLDEARTSYVSPETGLPLYTRIISNEGMMPKESVKNYLENPTAYHDFLTAIYQIRNGANNITFQEGERVFSVTAQAGVTEKVKADTGDFETTVSTVQSSFFDEIGIKDLRVNFSNDELRLPVLIRFKTQRGEFRASLASVQTVLPETAETTPTPTPRPIATPPPTPKPTPTPYSENEPLSSELPFALGETLTYRLTAQNRKIGTVVLQAKERKQVKGRDTLLLTATMTEGDTQRGIFSVGDSIKSYVDPLSIAPLNVEVKFGGAISGFNQTIQFEQTSGTVINMTNAGQYDVPVGTHGILSLAYAVRQFNLTPSKDPQNPVNDTRVAMFFYNKYYVLTLRPQSFETIEFDGKKITAQVVSISTGNPQIDQYNIKLWLSNDIQRLPLRLTAGNYRADLQSVTRIQPSSAKPELKP